MRGHSRRGQQRAASRLAWAAARNTCSLPCSRPCPCHASEPCAPPLSFTCAPALHTLCATAPQAPATAASSCGRCGIPATAATCQTPQRRRPRSCKTSARCGGAAPSLVSAGVLGAPAPVMLEHKGGTAARQLELAREHSLGERVPPPYRLRSPSKIHPQTLIESMTQSDFVCLSLPIPSPHSRSSSAMSSASCPRAASSRSASTAALPPGTARCDCAGRCGRLEGGAAAHSLRRTGRHAVQYLLCSPPLERPASPTALN
jgi:hypothetical protein